MFTGIIQHVGRVTGSTPGRTGRRLTIDVGPLAGRLAVGASLAVDGACLTVATIAARAAGFDVVPETLARTTLAGLSAGARVNLEPAIAAADALDGHIVQGHVDGLAEVARIDRGDGGHVLHLAADAELTARMVPKGSVALAGVSLTVADLADGRFTVALVPTTLTATTLGQVRIADPLNLELDIIGKYVRRDLARQSGRASGLTAETLRQAGFD